MKTSQRGIDLIKEFEGLRLKAYVCSGNKNTIGYGTTIYPNGSSVKLTDTCTKEQAETYLKNDLKRFEEGVTRLVGLPIHQLMFDSLVSFAYNLGLGNLKSSTLLKKVNLGKFKECENEFVKWNKALGKELPGLTRRRLAERDLFMQGLKEFTM